MEFNELDDWGDAPIEAPMRAPASPFPALKKMAGNLATASSSADQAGPATIQPTAKAAVLPHCDKPNHFPAFMSRSALFKVGRFDMDAASCGPRTIPAQHCQLIATGPRLNMRDKAVWEAAIQAAKEQHADVSQAFVISLRDLARRMGETDMCAERLDSIWESLARLAAARIEFKTENHGAGIGCLVATIAKKDGQCYLRLNADFATAALLEDKQFKLNTARRALLGSSIAQWMHDFLSTHSTAMEMDLAYIKGLCGYDGVARNFPSKLRAAMDEIVEKAPELVSSYEIIEGQRNSDKWKLSIVKGSDKPSFAMPPQLASRRPGGRGGVCL